MIKFKVCMCSQEQMGMRPVEFEFEITSLNIFFILEKLLFLEILTLWKKT